LQLLKEEDDDDVNETVAKQCATLISYI